MSSKSSVQVRESVPLGYYIRPWMYIECIILRCNINFWSEDKVFNDTHTTS